MSYFFLFILFFIKQFSFFVFGGIFFHKFCLTKFLILNKLLQIISRKIQEQAMVKLALNKIIIVLFTVIFVLCFSQQSLRSQAIIFNDIVKQIQKQMFTEKTKQKIEIKSPFQTYTPEPDTAGFVIGSVQSKTLLRSSQQSKLYQLNIPQLLDNRPYKLAQFIGTHYEVGYDYGALLGKQIVATYNTFLGSAGFTGWKRQLLELFMDWQYDSYVGQQIPHMFKEQLRGIQQGGSKQLNIHNLRALFQRTLVVSSYPGDFGADITYTLLDQFMRDVLRLKNQKLLNIVQDNLFQAVKFIRDFMHKKKIHCSFFATWGSRTQGSKLLTMRNLDWDANTGLNQNKMIFVWKVKDTIPHLTVGFPAMLGALTGMSKAGLTVHEAGLDSLRQTELGFQWTLRLRYIMMKAKNLQQAKQIWLSTNNTLGMNHMVASASDLATGQPVFVVETMRNYTAWFKDNDPRQNGTVFTDPKTGQTFVAGYAMKDAVFRTNHAYDPFINKYRTALPTMNQSTIKRYNVIKDTFKNYEAKKQLIGQKQALNITSNVSHKGGKNPYKCPQMGSDDGTNVISVVYVPIESRMFLAFEYGQKDKYHTAGCGVYVDINMKQWF